MLFRNRRMKQDQNQPKSDENPLDSIPFPDEKGSAGHCCHGAGKCKHGDEAQEDANGGKDAAEHECHCRDDEDKGGCSCGEEGGECECKGGEIDPELLAKLDAIVKENLTLRDMLVHATADFDNYRKRAVREKEEARKSANADIVGSLVPVLDTFALALDAAHKHHPEAAAVLEGIDMIMTQFKGVLKVQGVEEIVPKIGDDFSTALHESIAHQPSDTVADGKICAVARTGYTLNGKLLRAASVVLSKGKAV
jgi:molecular chaperone GrpE